MTAQLTAPPIPALDVETPAPPTAPAPPLPPRDRRLRRPVWNRFTALQLLVMALATIAPLVIVGTVSAAVVGLISLETMLSVALAAAENPGMIVFGAMFLASPIQWLTGRSQVRVRKYLGIVFFLLALTNGVMFAIESGVAAMLSAPFLVAGTLALALAAPLFLTSSRWSQRLMGMRRWRLLHKATYVIAAALMAHVVLMPDIGPGFVVIALGFIARIPAVKRWIQERTDRRRGGRSAVQPVHKTSPAEEPGEFHGTLCVGETGLGGTERRRHVAEYLLESFRVITPDLNPGLHPTRPARPAGGCH